jgi:thioesterase domain-containing protein
MAQRYVEAIDEFLPSGPIHLVGHSTGGLVAFEMARILERIGRPVGLVALLDTLFPLGISLRERIARQWEIVRRGGWGGLRTVAYWYWSTLRIRAGRLRHSPKWAYLRFRGRPLPSVLAGKRINHIATKAQRLYQPMPYSGTITYIQATGDEFLRFDTSAAKWESVAESVVLRQAPGRHSGKGSIVSEPNASALAEIIGREIAAMGSIW